jgi:serine/threonine protein kinase
MTLPSGARLGAYEIVALVGAGGMGEVYRATDTRLNRDVAIKVLPAAFAQDRERLARFEREAQLLAQLHHPHIASVFGLEGAPAGVDQAHGDRALIMEFVEGDDLATRLARGRVAVDEAIALARQIAEALEAAHDLGIVHRDLKPANVKVKADGTVKVLDFGLSPGSGALRPGGELRNDHSLPEGPTPDDLARQLDPGYHACLSTPTPMAEFPIGTTCRATLPARTSRVAVPVGFADGVTRGTQPAMSCLVRSDARMTNSKAQEPGAR